MFNVKVKWIKAHGGQLLHHPELADLHKKRIGKETTRREPNTDNIPSTRRNEITKVAIERGGNAANNEFLACQFILGADNS